MKVTSGRTVFNSMSYYLVHKFVSMSQAMKIPDAKGAVDKEWEKPGKMQALQLHRVRRKKEVILEAQKARRTVHFGTPMDN